MRSGMTAIDENSSGGGKIFYLGVYADYWSSRLDAGLPHSAFLLGISATDVDTSGKFTYVRSNSSYGFPLRCLSTALEG